MGDSDEDMDRRRRDRFARERNDYRDRGRDYERGDPFGRAGRTDYNRDYDRRRAYSPLRNNRDVSPPMKRSRYESDSGTPSQPAMMTFKQFLSTQDDCIDDDVAVKKYSEYKADFKRQQLEDFFKSHKDEEWFRLKYHPDECHKRKEELQANIEKRLKVYENVVSLNLLENVVLDVDKNNEVIIRLLDSVAILLEGGDEFDLKALDEPEPVVAPQSLEPLIAKPAVEKKEDSRASVEKTGDESGDEAKIEDEVKKSPSPKPEKEADDDSDGQKEKEESETMATEDKKEPEERKPRHLHRTSSIFFRTLSPAITKQEVEAMCRNYPGFLRVALAEPQPERKFSRRGWVTFERNVNTKEICWKLNNIRLRDTELGAILNRDLLRRVRSVNGITCSKQVMRADIKLAVRIIQNMDTQRGLYMVDDESKNPLFSKITDYLIEEASAEEEELLGASIDLGKNENGNGPERDAELTKALDSLLLYLRIVHSVDYYAHAEYHNEDEMPNRCGIIHARGSLPSSSISLQEIDDYIANFAQKCVTFVEKTQPVSAEEAKKLGLKTEEEELEKFMSKNCQQLDKDKFLCPLSGKKFKAPEFVHKHIQSRHGEKIEEVKKDAVYYNNYIMDPKRPALPEHPSTKQRQQGNGNSGGHPDPMASGPYGHYSGPGPYGYHPARPNYGPSGYPMRGYPPPDPYRYGNRRGGFSGAPRGIRDPRPVVNYNDLDAPPDFDLF